MSPGEISVVGTGAGAQQAAETLSRLLLATAGVGVLMGFAAVIGFGCWMSARFKAVERCIERLDREARDRRSPGSGKS